MGIKEIRKELESMGIGTKSFIEKSEFVNALIHARKQGKVRGDDEQAPGSGGDEEGPLCFICLDGSNDNDGPLRRDCVCRGDDAGYAHLKCLVEYAKSESMKLKKELLPSEVAMLRNRFTTSNGGRPKKEGKEGYDKSNIQEDNCVASTSGGSGDKIQGGEMFTSSYGLPMCMSQIVRDMIESEYANMRNMKILCKSWTECRNCRHRYQKDLALDMANECVSFVDMTYPECRYLHVQSLTNKLLALAEMAKGPVILTDFIQSMFDVEPGLRHYFEESTLNCLGLIVFDGETKEIAKEAIMYFRKLLELYQANGNPEGIHHCESNIANAQLRSGEKVDSSELQHFIRNKAYYESCIAKHGSEHAGTIFACVDVAMNLSSLHRTIEAERLIRKLVPLSRRILGPHHDTTKRAESVQERIIVQRIVYSRARYMMPMAESKNIPIEHCDTRIMAWILSSMDPSKPKNKQTQSTVPAASVSPAPGTPVMVVALDNHNFIGKIGDLREWNTFNMVYFDDKLLQPIIAPPECLRVVFDLPPEPEHLTMDFCFH